MVAEYRSKPARNSLLFLLPFWCYTCKISVSATPVTSSYIHNQDPLLTGIRLSQGTVLI